MLYLEYQNLNEWFACESEKVDKMFINLYFYKKVNKLQVKTKNTHTEAELLLMVLASYY